MTGDGWADRAACKGVDTAVFFPEIPYGDTRKHYWHRARTYCETCPVRADCLAFCLPFERAAGRRDGMWGGLTPQERADLDRPQGGTPVRFRA